MSYGLTLDQVKDINRPLPVLTPWGSYTSCTPSAKYSLHGFKLNAGGVQPLHFHPEGAARVFVESGEVLMRHLDENGAAHNVLLKPGQVMPLAPFQVHGFASRTGAELYLFGAPLAERLRFIPVESEEVASEAFDACHFAGLVLGGKSTTDRREKYWGRIETIWDGELSGKRLFVKKGGQSSLEYHVEKHESYWIQSGRLKVGLRIGRAENHSIILEPGESYDIRPGVMHMRIALEDTVIIEAGTKDSDADSYLVEDGQTYQHIEVETEDRPEPKQARRA